MSLAELTYLQLQDADAAAAVLAELDDALSRQELALPADGASQMSLFLRKTQLHLALGDAASCADSLLPLVQVRLRTLLLVRCWSAVHVLFCVHMTVTVPPAVDPLCPITASAGDSLVIGGA